MSDYPWYEMVETSNEITQGDVLKNCPVPILEEESESYEVDGSVNAEIRYIDGIILTQACDIENHKVENIILCGIETKTDFEKGLLDQGENPKEIKKHIEGIIKGQQNAYHIINKYEGEDFNQDYYIINFKEIFSVPRRVAEDIAKNNGKRLHLLPPYREHLSQAFARYFMRVGLPINIKWD